MSCMAKTTIHMPSNKMGVHYCELCTCSNGFITIALSFLNRNSLLCSARKNILLLSCHIRGSDFHTLSHALILMNVFINHLLTCLTTIVTL